MLSDMYQDTYRVPCNGDPGCVSSGPTEHAHLAALAENGYSTGLEMTGEDVTAIERFAREAELAVVGETKTFRYDELVAREDSRASPIATVVGSSTVPEVQWIAGHPMVARVVGAYLGYQPRRVDSWLVWSFTHDMSMRCREGMYQTIRFHFDVHGLSFMYMSFYLTDVDRDSGAHVVIRGSHRRKHLSDVLGSARISDEHALYRYGPDAQMVIEGRAGMGFFEDTACYHKALPPRSHPRLLLQLRYM